MPFGNGLIGFTVPKIDDQAVNGLLGTADSLAYKTGEIENHVHSAQQVYGATSAGVPTFVRRSLIPITCTAGDGAWGTEIIIHNGVVIEGGSATKKFDMNQLRISAVGTANRLAVYEVFTFLPGTPKAAAMVAATNKVTDATNTVANGDKVFFPTIASNTGAVVYEVYFVVNRAAGNFEISRTLAGASVDITGADGACTYVSLGASDADGVGAQQTLASETVVSRASGTPDAQPTPMQMSRQTCNRLVSIRGWSAGAGGNSMAFHMGLHTYPA